MKVVKVMEHEENTNLPMDRSVSTLIVVNCYGGVFDELGNK